LAEQVLGIRAAQQTGLQRLAALQVRLFQQLLIAYFLIQLQDPLAQ
jgi:hypothetical protein